YVNGFTLEGVDAYNYRKAKKAKVKKGKKGDSKKKVKLTADGKSVVRLIDDFCVMAQRDEAKRRKIFCEH
ncbi:hypothetical protein A2U01_0087276, partial [Trifolium medium]|nr:hypothetical protein [Trifolium medium]